MIGLTSQANSQLSRSVQAIQVLFYNLDELVYMTDMDTNELIYLKLEKVASEWISAPTCLAVKWNSS